MPSIQELENFIIYGKVRNFTLAANQANITQSAFSFQMKKLEETLGVKLILRSNRGSSLTPEGEIFYKKISEILPELVGVIYEFQQINGEKAIELKVGVLTSLGDILMNQHVNYFQKNKNILITVYSMEKNELIRALNNGKIDIASTFLFDDETLENFEKSLFRKDKIVYYAPKIKEISGTIKRDNMLKVPLVKYPPDNFMNKMIDQYFNIERKMPTVAAKLPSPYAFIEYCKQDTAGAFITERLLNTLGFKYKQEYFNIDPPYEIKAFLLYKKENPKYSAIKIFTDYVVKLNQRDS
ncbi:DNA-binding transcriptional LysR family regulator [Clostridium acetobutylicum]|uniref:Transcriptional regulator, LysR family n=1 Tax=Clostridium acetobutylicum (strain ATCC 824 / DSM 792 / JCM 1419 / IAM 19013 / LMG 5710 / NBRC 13948 / NRRL B-527 / VKM B-1787 / 2291 / W) TaxID=272562 RepID=Q97KZ8_CLOAB|nr:MULTISPECIES: LysR family transcriptional regulator [Clostridium]AAK78744.1 Transcriptional regulator, LysR family [Clostridium acetobutylicum ATCC 824]ADZ19818.1 Transcriptional regulator, LysR family [Clostridium acetobutylicum EA 2018]AEI33594.1 LysR family transcriptional regulator [Clostridium acetobutylicum DSM 1731]AWV80462.1 LysR family transcriptional regulator [Clostridium acetobutylicum]MBC2392653.1 LysR family transcriptional regulator [Clostridium acetobutylicum]